MNRDEEIGLRSAGDIDARLGRYIRVVVADEHRPESGRCVDASGKAARNVEHGILLIKAAPARCPRVMTTVSGIDNDNDIAIRIGRDNRQRRIRDSRIAEIDDDAMLESAPGVEIEALRVRWRRQVEDDPQIAARPRAGSHRPHPTRGGRQLERFADRSIRQVNDDAMRIAQFEDTVTGRALEIEHDACSLRPVCEANAR
jgi:hypothetical protein